MTPEAAREAALARYRYAPPPTRFAGVLGGAAGRGLGSSLDFAEFRDYQPGDDPRRLDWRAFARTDRLQTRLFREEVSPAFEVLLDASASMATTPAKERAAADLAALFVGFALRAGARPRTLFLGGEEAPPGSEPRFVGTSPSLAPPSAPLRARGLRLVISDFLTPEDPAPFLRRLAAGAADLSVVQLLDPWENAPTEGPATLLVDVETGARRALRPSREALRGYAERLARLKGSVETAVRGVGGRYACVVAASPEEMCGGALLRAGITEPR